MLDWLKDKARGKPKKIDSWRDADAFAGMTDAELSVVAPLVTTRRVGPGEMLAHEGQPASEVYIVQDGELAIIKGKGSHQRVMGHAKVGEVVGEVSLFDEMPRSAGARATVPTTVWVLDFHQLRPSTGLIGRSSTDTRPKPARTAYHQLLENLATVMADRVRMQDDQLHEGARQREVMGRFLVSILLLICLYTFMLSGLDVLGEHAPANTTLVSVPIQIVFAFGSTWFIVRSGYPLSMFGIGFKHLLGSLVEALLFTVPALGLFTLIKQIILWVKGNPNGVPLIAHTDVVGRFQEADVIRWFAIYAVTCVVQELIVRGALQSTLEMFLTGPRRRLSAIVVSAMLFSMTHLHMSFLFATLAFLPGLFWGWLFSRRRNLVGVTVSHAIVGGYVFFVMGVAL
ncbi:MAG: cyclic nucleotide-binding domain-containing protein [Polyangiaceae bacterium]